MMTTAQFPNWFAHYADAYFERHLLHLAGRPGLHFIQIGAFTGDASKWMVENVLTGSLSTLDDVDTWEGSDEPEHEAFDWADVETTYREKVAPLGDRVIPFRMPSAKYWQQLAAPADFVYIDGDHTAAGVLADAVSAYRWLQPGGLLAFDDYRWKPYPDAPPELCPATAIDAFIDGYRHSFEVLEVGLQVWLRKIA